MTIEKKPLLERFSWAYPALLAVLALYGAASYAAQRILSAQAMRGALSMAAYQAASEQTGAVLGVAASALLFVLGVLSVLGARRRNRVALILWLPAALAPAFSAYAIKILFTLLALPGMNAGSVIAAAAAALLLAVPCLVAACVLAGSKTLPRWARVTALLGCIAGLFCALFPTAVAVLALLIFAGKPFMAPYMAAAAVMLHAKYVIFAAALLPLAFGRNGGKRHG